MAQAAEDLLIKVDATTEQLRRELRRADESVQRFDKNVGARLQKFDRRMERLNQRFDNATRAVRGFAAAFAGIQVARFGSEALRTAENIDRVSRSLNVSRRRVQELQFTFARFGLQGDQVSEALQTIADRAQDAIDGTKSVREDFQAIGVSVDQLRGKNPAELFDLVARAIANTEDPTRRAAAAVRILEDEMGQRLLPLLSQGPQALDRFAKQAQRAGVVMSDSLVKRSAQAASQIDQLRLSISRGFERGFLQGVSSDFRDMGDAMVEAGNAGRRFGELLGTGVNQAADALEFASRHTEELTRALQAMIGLRIGRFVADLGGLSGKFRLLAQVGTPVAGVMSEDLDGDDL
jgi:hypothetical protein